MQYWFGATQYTYASVNESTALKAINSFNKMFIWDLLRLRSSVLTGNQSPTFRCYYWVHLQGVKVVRLLDKLKIEAAVLPLLHNIKAVNNTSTKCLNHIHERTRTKLHSFSSGTKFFRISLRPAMYTPISKTSIALVIF